MSDERDERDESTVDADESDEFPVADHAWGFPVPDLRRIPRDRWAEALRPLPHKVRQRALGTVPQGGATDALVLLTELELEDADREQSAREVARRPDVPAPPAGPIGPRDRRWGRQISLRLSHEQFERLRGAASHLGLTHTQCARMFVVNGSARVVYERDRAGL